MSKRRKAKAGKDQAITQEQLAEMLIVSPARRRRASFRYRSLGRTLIVLLAVAFFLIGLWGILRGFFTG